MDFGLTEMESLVGQHQQGGSSDQNGKRKLSGSGSGSSGEDEISRASIHTRNGHDLGLSKQKSLLRSTGSCDGGFGGSQQPQMLSFSSPSSDGGGGGGGGSLLVSYYQNPPAPVYHRNAGYASGSMQGSFTGIRGPFTPAQWIELEHQALIYKYLTANVPVPPTLLVPLRRAFISTSLSGFAPQSYGWAPFHLGYPTSTDPEPGRCRRTDGKKWRCSRDAVPDQKYCERHINRGRHRSRKPVEVQTGQAASGGPANPKVGPISSAMSSPATTGGSLSNNTLAIKNLQAGVPNLVTNTVVNRYQGSQGLSMMPTSKDSTFAVPKQQVTYETSPHQSFGFVPSESLVNPPSKASYLNYKSYNSFFDINDQQSQNPHLTDNWKKDGSFPNHSTVSWPEEVKPDWTQLSMSTAPSSSSSNQEKEAGPKNGTWVPLSWGNSMGSGGCLEEIVLNSAVGNEGWDGSPSFSSSPTDVLQTGASMSLSNSGSGDENKVTTLEESNLGDDDLLCSAHVASSF